MRALDWSTSPLGPLSSWPQSLRTSVSTMLRSPYPIILFWGPARCMLYNDPFQPILGAKHPGTLGARAHEALAEEWKLLGPLMDRVYETGEPLFIENGNVNFARRLYGLREEAYFTWSYNPTIGEQGEIAGLFAIASETTRQVIGERRLAILRELSLRTALERKADDVFRSLEAVLANAGHDTPFAMLYVLEGDRARLVSCAGLAPGTAAAPVEIARSQPCPWPLFEVAQSQQERLLEALDGPLPRLPGGPWPEPSTKALMLPVPMGSEQLMGVLVAGLSPLGALDNEYKSFLQLLARQLSASIASARAYEDERRRAEELAALDKAKTAFFSNVSHELRTPLTLILGPVEDALARADQTLAADKLALVRRNAARLLKMVNNLLDFSRMESGRAQASLIPTELSSLTARLASQFSSAVESSGLTLTIDCPALPEPVLVDHEMWEKIVLNLLSNALKYTHAGSIRVAVRWHNEGAELTVEDTGVGIAADDLARVFERFYRVQSAHGRSYEGTGIGLSLVQELVKLHSGTVDVTSTFGKGSCFRVSIPRAGTQVETHRARHASTPPIPPDGSAFVDEAIRWSVSTDAVSFSTRSAQEVHTPRTEARILVVDDNADLRSYVVDLLSRDFTHVDSASDGVQALQRIAEQLPDLVLSDVMMPNLDGLGLVRALRQQDETRAIPLILLSARAGDDPTVDGLSVGADDYLVKPFSARELLARVRTQLTMARIRREAARQARSEKELRAELKARDEWLSLVSHELRTPLSAALLSAHALLDAVPEELQPLTAPVTRSFDRLTKQVDYLTDVAELASGRLTVSVTSVDVSAIVLKSVQAAREAAARARCPLRAVLQTPLRAQCDAERLRQLLHHLLDNAFKFAAGAPVEVTLDGTVESLTIQVVDHGTGVPEEARGRVFRRFQRATPVHAHAGFGLGLWVAQQITNAHGGTIDLSETDGGGTTVSVSLPCSTNAVTHGK